MDENIILQVARGRVDKYAGESVDLMRQHAEAMECRDCEDYLKRGIDAFKWVQRAQDMLRELEPRRGSIHSPARQRKRLISSTRRGCDHAKKLKNGSRIWGDEDITLTTLVRFAMSAKK